MISSNPPDVNRICRFQPNPGSLYYATTRFRIAGCATTRAKETATSTGRSDAAASVLTASGTSWFQHGKLVLTMSSYVDDLKGGDTAEAQELVLGELQKMVDGELKHEAAQTDQCRCNM